MHASTLASHLRREKDRSKLDLMHALIDALIAVKKSISK